MFLCGVVAVLCMKESGVLCYRSGTKCFSITRNYEYICNIMLSLHEKLLHLCVYYAVDPHEESLNPCVSVHLACHPISKKFGVTFGTKMFRKCFLSLV